MSDDREALPGMFEGISHHVHSALMQQVEQVLAGCEPGEGVAVSGFRLRGDFAITAKVAPLKANEAPMPGEQWNIYRRPE